MAKYRPALPQLSDKMFLTDGGVETSLVFHHGLELPYFAAFDLLRETDGRRILRDWFHTHARIATEADMGFILESATWRASKDWGKKLGYSCNEITWANQDAISLLSEIRDELETETSPMVISGCIGPRDDGYSPRELMTSDEAAEYHLHQARAFQDSDADLITAVTMTYAEEAIGIVRAAQFTGMPVVISFTTETDGRLPSGQTLRDAIEQVDRETNGATAYYMINCAHPTHFEDALEPGAAWTARIRAIRANASTKSHAELDASDTLDDGDPLALGASYGAIRALHPNITIMGGCCGTDQRHIEAIGHACHIHHPTPIAGDTSHITATRTW